MSRIYRFTLLFIFLAMSLACGLISNPLSQAQNLAATAQSMATSMTTSMPSGMPDVSGYLNPVGAPVSDWNSIPIMPQATAGQEFNKNTYSYKVSGVAVADIQAFYTDKLKTLGWTSAFSAQGGTQGGMMLFTKGTNVFSLVTTPGDNNGLVVILIYQ
jgi:hypothetical protein